VNIRDNFLFHFFSTLNRYFLHIPYVASNNFLKTKCLKLFAGPVNRQYSDTGKRLRNESSWKCMVAKAKREKGEAYVSISTKKDIPAKSVRTKTCGSQKCPYKCSKVFQLEDRLEIHRSFWDLSRQSRQDFYTTNIKRFEPVSASKKVKKYSYMYTFDLNGVAFRVCKEFFCNTLDVSASSLSHHLKMLQNPESNFTRQGKHRKKYVSEARLNEVRDHINSFLCVPSHNCRSDSTRKYYRRDVRNIKQMYNWYVQSTDDPVKLHTYAKVFNKEKSIAKNGVCNMDSTMDSKTEEAGD
jgi:hypothetical protein